jgi:chemotaxis protein MotB
MAKYVRKRNDDGDGANWMTTYSDLVTLLLTFFVMLFSMAAIDNQKYEEVRKSLRSSFLKISGGEKLLKNEGEVIFNLTDQSPPGKDQEKVENVKEKTEEGQEKSDQSQEYEEQIIEKANQLIIERAEAVKKEMTEAIEKLGLSEYVSVVREQRYVVFRVSSVVLFELGKADIKDSGEEVLDRLSALLAELGSDILVQGHADDLPINTVLFPSNWELSTKRATNVVKYLVDFCNLPPEKLTATGNGEFRPIKPNDTPENRQENRRVDIVIADDYSPVPE